MKSDNTKVHALIVIFYRIIIIVGFWMLGIAQKYIRIIDYKWYKNYSADILPVGIL